MFGIAVGTISAAFFTVRAADALSACLFAAIDVPAGKAENQRHHGNDFQFLHVPGWLIPVLSGIESADAAPQRHKPFLLQQLRVAR